MMLRVGSTYPWVSGKRVLAALPPNLMECAVQYGPAVELSATGQLSGLTKRFVPLFIAAGSVDPASSKS